MRAGLCSLVTIVLLGMLPASALAAEEAQAPVEALLAAARWSDMMGHDKDVLEATRVVLAREPGNAEAKALRDRYEAYADLDRLRKAADAGDARAMVQLGWAYNAGEKVKQDHARAAALFRSAAEAGEPRGLRSLGLMLAIGRGVERNSTDATACYQAAAAAGDAIAHGFLAERLMAGVGIERDMPAARQHLEKAAAANHVPSMLRLAALAESTNDEEEAAQWRDKVIAHLRAVWKAIPTSEQAPLMLGDVYRNLGDDDQAVEVYTQGALATGNANMLERAVQLLTAQNAAVRAEARVDQVLQKHPKVAALWVVRAWLCVETDKLDAALAAADEALKLDPKAAMAHYYRGQVLLRRADIAGAVKAFTQARDLNPEHRLTRMELASALYSAGRFDEAAAQYEYILEKEADNAGAREVLVRLFIEQKKWDKAQRLLDEAEGDRALKENPLWPRLRSLMWSERGDAAKSLEAARAAFERNPNDAALLGEYLDALLKQQDGPKRVLEETEGLKFNQRGAWRIPMMRGAALVKQGKQEEAQKQFVAAMDRLDREFDVTSASALAERMIEDLGAKPAMKALAARQREYWLVPLGMACVEAQDAAKAADTADALMDVATLAKDDGQAGQALWMAASLYGMASHTLPTLEKAEKAYVKFIALRDISADLRLTALNNYAYLLVDHPRQPDPKKALRFSQEAYDKMMASQYRPFIADTQAWVLFKLGRADEALPILRRAVADPKDGDSPEVRYHLAEVLLAKGQVKEAVAELERAKEGLKKPRKEKTAPIVAQRIEEGLARAKKMEERSSPQTRPSRP